MIQAVLTALPQHMPMLLGLGVVAGFLAGLIGIGGGFVLVPGLLAVFTSQTKFGVDVMPTVLATTMGCMVFTAAAATRAHAKRGSIDYLALKRLGPCMAAGAVVGAFLATVFPTHFIKMAFGAFCLYSAARMLLPRSPSVAADTGFSIASGSVVIQGTLFGTVCGLIGVGGANLVVPFLLKRGLQMRAVVATASALQLPIASVATITYMILGSSEISAAGSLGYVRLPEVAVLALGSLSSAPLGVMASYRLPVPVLKRVFGAFTAVVGLRMLGITPF